LASQWSIADHKQARFDNLEAGRNDSFMFKIWWKFELSVAKRAFGETSLSTLGKSFIIGVLAYLLQYFVGLRGQHDTWLMIFISLGLAVAFILGEFLFKLLFIPAKMANEQKQKYDSAIEDHTEESVRAAATHNQTIECLQIEITKLREQINDRTAEDTKLEKRKLVKDYLGLSLSRIEGQIVALKTMQWYEFKDKVADKVIDEWANTVGEISTFLQKNLSIAEASYFQSISEMRETPVDDDPILRGTKGRRQRLLDSMSYRASQLREIIKTLM
jgi:hypothetical protein